MELKETQLVNLVMDNYDVYDIPNIANRDVRETVEFMMSNWKHVDLNYKAWRIDMTIKAIKEDIEDGSRATIR